MNKARKIEVPIMPAKIGIAYREDVGLMDSCIYDDVRLVQKRKYFEWEQLMREKGYTVYIVNVDIPMPIRQLTGNIK